MTQELVLTRKHVLALSELMPPETPYLKRLDMIANAVGYRNQATLMALLKKSGEAQSGPSVKKNSDQSGQNILANRSFSVPGHVEDSVTENLVNVSGLVLIAGSGKNQTNFYRETMERALRKKGRIMVSSGELGSRDDLRIALDLAKDKKIVVIRSFAFEFEKGPDEQLQVLEHMLSLGASGKDLERTLKAMVITRGHETGKDTEYWKANVKIPGNVHAVRNFMSGADRHSFLFTGSYFCFMSPDMFGNTLDRS